MSQKIPQNNLPFPNKKIGGKNQKRKRGKADQRFPLVSIITPVLNALKELEKNIESVRLQAYPNKEHIIIDGGSTDGTLEFLERKDGELDYWLSEADAGIYDAMNKGIDAARGEWLYFLGGDDVFYRNDTLISFMEIANAAADAALAVGNIVYPNGKIFRSRLGKTIYSRNTIHHQGVFYRRSVFDRFRYGTLVSPGTINYFHISGDYQLNLKLFTENAKYIYIDEIIAKCGRGISMEGRLSGYLEEIIIRHLYMNYFKAIFFDILTLLRYGWKKIDFRNYRKL